MWLTLLLACAAEPPRPAPPTACDVAFAPAGGPVSSDPIALAEARIGEARKTGDPGFYTLAESAAECALVRTPGDLRARRALVHIAVQFHEFAAAEAGARALVAETDAWQDLLLLGDAAMEQGKIDDARVAWEAGLARRPGLQLYDRMSFLAYATGDAEAAMAWAEAAVSAGTPADPEPLAWALTRLGWLRALDGQLAPEIGQALLLLPDYPPARFARGRIRLHSGMPGAEEDLRAAGRTVEAVRALAEIDPSVDVEAVLAQDPRGAAIWLADRDPERALVLLKEELEARQDAQTQLAWAYAAHRAGRDATALARAAIATGILEPRALLHGGIVLGDRSLLDRALASGAGLLPSERAIAVAARDAP